MKLYDLWDIASFSPKLPLSPSAWLGHTPFAAWVIKESSPITFVELGTHFGHSYFSFCQAVREYSLATKCYAVDLWQGDEHAGVYGNEVFDQVNKFHQDHYTGFSTLMRMTFDEAVTYFADESIDLLHIDGLHTYEAVTHDFETWLPKLAPGAVIMFHDINVRERNFGVWKLWEELREQYPNNIEFAHSSGLGVMQLNHAPDKKKLEWMQSEFSEKQVLIEYFAALGKQQLNFFELQKIKLHAKNLENVIQERNDEIPSLNNTLDDYEAKLNENKLEITKLYEEKNEQLQVLNKQLDKHKQEKLNVIKELQTNAAVIEKTQENLRFRDEKIQELNARLNLLIKESQDLQNRLQEKNQIFNIEQSSLQRIIDSLNKRLNFFVKEKQDLQNKLQEKNQIFNIEQGNLQGVIDSLNKKILTQKEELIKLNRFLINREEFISSLLYSRSWRITRPLRGMFSLFRSQNNKFPIIENHDAIVEKEISGQNGSTAQIEPPREKEAHQITPPAIQLVGIKFGYLRALRVFSSPNSTMRINLVTDSINGNHFFGGVATSIIFAVMLAQKKNVSLRILTLREVDGKHNVNILMKNAALSLNKGIEFEHLDIHSTSSLLEASTDDIYITTSWWTTWIVKETIVVDRIIYFLQEDERMFYPYSDEQLRCAEVLQTDNLKILVNTRMLYDHFVKEGFENIKKVGGWFEPSFMKSSFYMEPMKNTNKKKLFFYSRPNNLRNLFYRGIEILEYAIRNGVINLNEWDIYFIGKDTPDLLLADVYQPIVLLNMDWNTYAETIRGMHLGLCLMYTPHPSYPPLDLAASGAVVLTNKFPGKNGLEMYSKNILCRDIAIESMVDGLREAIQLEKNERERVNNYKNNSILRDWHGSFKNVFEKLGVL